MAVEQQTVIDWYEAILQRSPTPTELSSGMGMESVDLLASLVDRADEDVSQVVRLFQGVFDRVPGAGGLEFWVGRLRDVRDNDPDYDPNNVDDVRGSLIEAMQDWFDPAKTPEIAELVDVTDNEALVNLLFMNFLDREPQPAGLEYWVTQLENGMTVQQLVVHFSESEEFMNRVDADVDAYLLDLVADASQFDDGEMNPALPDVSGDNGGGEAFVADAAQALTSSTDALTGADDNDLFTSRAGLGENYTGFSSADDENKTANGGDVLFGGAGRDAFQVVKDGNQEDDGVTEVRGVEGHSIEVGIIKNRDEEDTDFDGSTDLLGDDDFGHAAHFYEDNGDSNVPDQGDPGIDDPRDPNEDTQGVNSVLDDENPASPDPDANGTTEELNGVHYNYFDVASCLPALPLTKQLPVFPMGDNLFNISPDWLEVSFSEFNELEEVFITDSENGVLVTDVQQNFWDTFATLTMEDSKADIVLFDSDRQANTGTDLNVNVDQVSLSHLVLTENYEEEANHGDQIPAIHITGGDVASVIGNIQNGVTDRLFLSGEFGPDDNPGLDNSGYSSATTTITVNAGETTDTGKIIDGQNASIKIPHSALCLDPEFDEQFDIYLGTVVGLGDRLPGLDTFDGSNSTGDILAVFAKSNINVSGGFGEDYFIWDELGETGSNFNFTGATVDGGEGFDQIALFSDDLATLERSGPVTNVEVLVAAEPVGFGEDLVVGDSPNDEGFDDPDLGDGEDASLFDTNVLNDGPGSADASSPVASNDPFVVDLQNFDEALQYMHFASGVDSDIEVRDHAADNFTIEFNQVSWDPRDEDGAIFDLLADSGIFGGDAGGLPGSNLASIIENPAVADMLQREPGFEGFDLHIGSDRVEDQRVNLHFNVNDIDGEVSELDQVWNGVNEEDIDGVPNHVQSIVDGEDNAGPAFMSRVDTLEIHAANKACDGEELGGTDLFVDNIVTKSLKTLYLSDDGQAGGAIRAETGSTGRAEGSGAMLTVIDGSRTWDVVNGMRVEQTGMDVNCEGDAYDQLLVRLEECDCFPMVEETCKWATAYKVGHDWLDVTDAEDGAVFVLGEGNDAALGGMGNDKMYGHGGNDILLGAEGDDTIDGGEGADVAQGGAGADIIWMSNTSGGGKDVAFGGSGNDSIYGSEGNEIVYGGGDEDFIVAMGGDDSIAGGSGKDRLLGGEGNDVVVGEGNDDLVDADIGTDVLVGDGYMPGDCECPCVEITVTGACVGNGDTYTISWNGTEVSFTHFGAPDGITNADVATNLKALLQGELGGDFTVTTEDETIIIKPNAPHILLPDFTVNATDMAINGTGFQGVDKNGREDSATVVFEDQYDIGDILTFTLKDADGNVLGTAQYEVGGEPDPECPVKSLETGEEIAANIVAATGGQIGGGTIEAVGNVLTIVAEDNDFNNYTLEGEVTNVEDTHLLTLEADLLEPNDTAIATFELGGDSFEVEAYVDVANGLPDILYNYSVNGTVVAEGVDSNLDWGTFADTGDTVNLLGGLALGMEAAIEGEGNAMVDVNGPSNGFEIDMNLEVNGALIEGLELDLDESEISGDADFIGYTDCTTDIDDVVVANAMPNSPVEDLTQGLEVEYCLDPDGHDLFVTQSEGLTASAWVTDEGFDNDYLPNDYDCAYVAGPLGFTGTVEEWLEDYGSEDVTNGDGNDTGHKGVTYVVDFKSMEFYHNDSTDDTNDDGDTNGLDDDGVPSDRLAFRDSNGNFAEDATSANFEGVHNVESDRDEADANAYSAFASNDELLYFAISNDGQDGGDQYLRVYYNEKGTDATPDAVFDLVGYNNVQTQFNFNDISSTVPELDPSTADTTYTEADYEGFL